MQRRGVPPRLAEALAAAGAAQAVCAPVVAVLSARVSLVAVPCNLLAEFAVAPATVLGFAALATAPVAMPVAEALAWCASWPAGWIADIARTGAALPGAGVDWPGSWTGALLLVLVTVVVVLVGRAARAATPGWCAACAVLLLLLVVVRPPPLTRVITGWPPPGWRFAMCDVGQGDATVLAAGDGAGVVVDAGPDPVLVDRCLRHSVSPGSRWSCSPTSTPTMWRGCRACCAGGRWGRSQTTGFEEPADQAEFVRREAAARRIPLTRAVAGEERRTGSLDLAGAVAAAATAVAPDGPNDASVDLLVRTAGLILLLLGDLEPPAQRELAEIPSGRGAGSRWTC